MHGKIFTIMTTISLLQQTSRQMRIINAVSQFVSNISASSRTVTVETLNIFAHSLSNDLMENAREAVKDYFTWQVA